MKPSDIVNDKLKTLTEDLYWENRDTNYGVLASIHLDKDGGVTDFNTNIDVDNSNTIDNIFKYLTKHEYKRLVIFTRTDKEVGNNYNVPNTDTLKDVEQRCTDNILNYYNFIQNPYPDGIPKFKLDSDSFGLRFGFDNTCEIDKIAVNKAYRYGVPMVDSEEPTKYNIIIMCTKMGVEILDER